MSCCVDDDERRNDPDEHETDPEQPSPMPTPVSLAKERIGVVSWSREHHRFNV